LSAKKFVLFDSSVLIDQWRFDRHRERMDTLGGIVYVSSVVLAELWRGATEKQEFKTLDVLQRNYRVLVPTEKNWIDSGQILTAMRHDHGFSTAKLRDLHFDVLIALTARNHGATLITSNRADFELIHSYRPFDLEIW
jgi:predicted nucleic acid-binding protein